MDPVAFQQAVQKLQKMKPGDDKKYSIVITDTNLEAPGPTILYIGGDYEALTGYTPAEMIGKSPRILQGPDSDRKVLRRLRETCLRGDHFQGTVVNYRKDGTPFMMCWAISPIYVDGKIAYFFAIQCDATTDNPAPIAAIVAKRISAVKAALDSAGSKLQSHVDQIGNLLLQAAKLQEDDNTCNQQ